MPLYPSVEPSLSDFPTQPELSTLPDDQPHDGPAPWCSLSALPDDPDSSSSSSSPARAPLDFEQHASPLVFGCGVFGQGMYNPSSHTLASALPLRTVRLALRYGLNAFDTSPYYFPSEFVLGGVLRRLAPEFPRERYFLISKAGRYGPERAHFDYSPERVVRSLEMSCERLGTDYLDVALLHDVEFVVDRVGRSHEAGWEAALAVGDHGGGTATPTPTPAASSPSDTLAALGLAPTLEAARTIHGAGDERFLAAVAALFTLKDRGRVRRVGISGYPLPVLLRLARLVATHPPYRPLDAVLTYSHHTLHADLVPAWRALFAANPGGPGASTWRAPTLLNGSPFSMGLLVDSDPPEWHPASAELKRAASEASALARERGTTLPAVALTYGMRGAEVVHPDAERAPRPARSTRPAMRTLVGLSDPEQVHQTVSAYRTLCARPEEPGEPRLLCHLDDPKQRETHGQAYRQQVEVEDEVRRLFQQRGVREWSWSSGL